VTCNWNTTVTRDSTTASLYPTIHNVYIQGTGDAYVDLSQDSGSFSAHWMGVGYYGNGSFTHNGGTNVLSTLSVGEGAYGRYDLNYGTLLAGTLSLGLNGDGSTYGYFQQTAGTASIQFLSMGANSGGTGQCNMLGGSLSVGSAIIGDEGAGYFVLDSATANFTASGSIMIGRAGTGTSVFSHGLGTLSAGELVAGAGGQALYVLANTASLHTTGDQIFGGNLDTGSAGIGTMVSVTRTTPAAACVEISSIDPAATHEAG
jgi:hypothetical protein